MKLKIIQFIALILLTLVTGLFWGTWFTLSRSIETFSAGEFIHIGKTIIRNVADPMKFMMPLCILSMLISIWFYPEKKSPGFYLGVFAFALIIVTLYITVGIEVPMDNQIKQWTVASVPGNWLQIRMRWEIFHTIRTFTSLASFAGFTASIQFKDELQRL
jgi:uncharacterized membrane protein